MVQHAELKLVGPRKIELCHRELTFVVAMAEDANLFLEHGALLLPSV
jgi:hypothetical protein